MQRELLEEKLAILEAIKQRRANDPVHLWLPHDKQRAFINSVLGNEYYENWAFWANRAGKSDAGALCGAKQARFGLDNPRPAIGPHVTVYDRATSGWVVSLDFPSSRDIIQPKYFDNGFVPAGSTHAPFIPDREIEGYKGPGDRPSGWRVSDQVLRLKNGSIIGFKSADSGRKKFQGTERDWVHFDEEPPLDIYVECTLRVGARRLRVFGTCTLLPPEGQVGGVSWAFEKLIQPWQQKKLPGVQLFTASIYDNPHIPREDIARLEAKYPEGSLERRIRLNGELLPGLAGARAYAAFERSLHLKKLGPPEFRKPLCWMLDFNVQPMVSLIGQRVNGVFRVHKEIIQNPGSVIEMAYEFKRQYPTHGAEIWIYGDATGGHRDAQTGKSDYALLVGTLRDYPVPLRLRVPDRNPAVPDSINAVNRALKDEQGSINVEIDESCEDLPLDLENVLRDPHGGIKKTYNPKDPYFYRTHTSDSFRYWVSYEAPVTSEPLSSPRTVYQYTGRTTIRMPQYGNRERQR